MTGDHEPNDGEQPDDAEDVSEDDARSETERPRKRFRAATPEELDGTSFIVQDDRAALRVRMFGGNIEHARGDADFIGDVLRRLARLLSETAKTVSEKTENVSPPLLRMLAFQHSVVIELELGDDENVQETLDGSRTSPTIRAANRVAELLAADSEKVLPLAVELGEDAAREYKQLLSTLSSDDVTLEWQPAGSERLAVTTSQDALVDFLILDAPGDEATEELSVPGQLTMADSRHNRFTLSLPSSFKRPPIIKGRRVIDGEYDEDVNAQLKAENLWDAPVVARIRVTYEAAGTTAIPRDKTFELLSARGLGESETASMFGPSEPRTIKPPSEPPQLSMGDPPEPAPGNGEGDER